MDICLHTCTHINAEKRTKRKCDGDDAGDVAHQEHILKAEREIEKGERHRRM